MRGHGEQGQVCFYVDVSACAFGLLGRYNKGSHPVPFVSIKSFKAVKSSGISLLTTAL